MKPKYKRAIVVLELGVPEEWTMDGGKEKLISQIEDIMRSHTSGSGPGNSTLMAMYLKVWVPGQDRAAEEGLEQMRVEYPLMHRDPHEPPPYPGEGLEFRIDTGLDLALGAGLLDRMMDAELEELTSGTVEPPTLGFRLGQICICGQDIVCGVNGVTTAVRTEDNPECPLHHPQPSSGQ